MFIICDHFVVNNMRSEFVYMCNQPIKAFALTKKFLLKNIFEKYPASKYDIAATFWDRAGALIKEDGLVGCLANRSIFFGKMLEGWRKKQFVDEGSLDVCVDLGLGLLDAAMVEAMASVSTKSCRAGDTVFIKESSVLRMFAMRTFQYRYMKFLNRTFV